MPPKKKLGKKEAPAADKDSVAGESIQSTNPKGRGKKDKGDGEGGKGRKEETPAEAKKRAEEEQKARREEQAAGLLASLTAQVQHLDPRVFAEVGAALTAVELPAKQQIKRGELKLGGTEQEAVQIAKEKAKLVQLKKAEYLRDLKRKVHEQRITGSLHA